jgi:hypothetical protein
MNIYSASQGDVPIIKDWRLFFKCSYTSDTDSDVEMSSAFNHLRSHYENQG